MKKHAIIPVFIPHLGCPHKCVFCDQDAITARRVPVSGDEVRETIETWLTTLSRMDLDSVEISFYGGSFTAIPMELQTEYLRIGYEYVSAGAADSLHLSTRPDAVSGPVLDNLERFGVQTVELGVQSFSDDVLARSKRGHDAACVYEACRLIKQRGIKLGIQLMTGLPGSTPEKDIESAGAAASLRPELARIYPTVVLDGTELADMLRRGEYEPYDFDTSVRTCAEMYKILTGAGTEVMRVGLKSTDLINPGADLGGTYHPSFRQIVESVIARESMERALIRKYGSEEAVGGAGRISAAFGSRGRCFSAMPGYRGMNRKYFAKKYPKLTISYVRDENIADNTYVMIECKNLM
ncbi:MAG: radical SAM protein [Anaerovoracaceae bacterium]|nr:radical SAM protein [Anaerovoracaceae bacterium]